MYSQLQVDVESSMRLFVPDTCRLQESQNLGFTMEVLVQSKWTLLSSFLSHFS